MKAKLIAVVNSKRIVRRGRRSSDLSPIAAPRFSFQKLIHQLRRFTKRRLSQCGDGRRQIEESAFGGKGENVKRADGLKPQPARNGGGLALVNKQHVGASGNRLWQPTDAKFF